MLGAADADYAYRIADALIARDGPALLGEARALTERSVSLVNALEELAALFHRIAVCQTVPEAAEALPDTARVKALARAFAPESVQLAYQICVQGRADLALAPDEATGFSMTLLRLLAFEPASGPGTDAATATRDTTTSGSPTLRAATSTAAPGSLAGVPASMAPDSIAD